MFWPPPGFAIHAKYPVNPVHPVQFCPSTRFPNQRKAGGSAGALPYRDTTMPQSGGIKSMPLAAPWPCEGGSTPSTQSMAERVAQERLCIFDRFPALSSAPPHSSLGLCPTGIPSASERQLPKTSGRFLCPMSPRRTLPTARTPKAERPENRCSWRGRIAGLPRSTPPLASPRWQWSIAKSICALSRRPPGCKHV